MPLCMKRIVAGRVPLAEEDWRKAAHRGFRGNWGTFFRGAASELENSRPPKIARRTSSGFRSERLIHLSLASPRPAGRTPLRGLFLRSATEKPAADGSGANAKANEYRGAGGDDIQQVDDRESNVFALVSLIHGAFFPVGENQRPTPRSL